MRWNKTLQAFFSKHQEDNLPIQPSVKKTTERTWLNFLISIFIIFCTSALRIVFFNDLGRTTPYLTYYPAVMIAALIGGLPTGLIATFFSAILVFIWLKQGQMSSVELWAMVFFVMICTMISWLAHAMRKANKTVTQMKQNLEKIVEERTKELRKSEERYELAVDGSAVGMYDWDINSGRVYYSGLFKELLGYDAEEPWDKLEDAWSRIHPDDYQTVQANIERYNEKANSSSLSHEFRLKTRSGEYRWYHGKGKTIWDKDGKPVRMAGSMTDITEAKLSQEKLLRSEQRFRSLVENANEAIIVAQDGTVKYGNRQISELTRYTPEELGLRDFLEFIHPEDRETVIREYQTRLSGERPKGNYSIRIVTKDRSEKYVLVNSALIDWEHKPATLVMLTDITDLKKREQDLLKAQQIAQMGSYDWDFKNDRLYASEVLIRLIGTDFEGEYTTSDYFSRIVHPDDLDFVRENLELAIKGEKKYDIEHRILRPDGTVIWVSSQAELIRDADGVPERLVGTGIDITEQKNARDKLLNSEQRFRSLMEQSPLAIELLTPQGRIFQVNSAWKRLWGINDKEADQVLAKYDMLTDKEAEDRGVMPLIKKAFAGEPVILPPIQYSAQNVAKEIGIDQIKPNFAWIQCHLFPVKDEREKVKFVVNTYLDLTKEKQVEKQINQIRSELIHATRRSTMGELTAALAHELNQPLTAILSNAQAGQRFLEKKEPDIDEVKEILTDIVSDDNRAKEIIVKLRSLMKRNEMKFKEVDINDVINKVVPLVRSDSVIKNINLNIQLKKNLPGVFGDQIQLQQVMVNLILNGFEAMSDVDSKELVISTKHDNPDSITVCIQDSGIGIEEENAEKLFKPFISMKKEGMGMGLSISKNIVESHRGKIWAKNNPDKGATFCFSLPIHKEGSSEKG